jgi:hypothetical protein
VDDLVIARRNVDLILGLKKKIVDTFEMIDLGRGIQFLQMDDGIFISQPKYVLNF